MRPEHWAAAAAGGGRLYCPLDPDEFFDEMGENSAANGATDFQDQYHALLAAAVDAIVVISRDGLMQELNPAAVRMFGYQRKELLGRNVRELMPERYSREHDGYLKHYLDTREARIIGIGREVTGRRKNGEEFPMDLAVGEIQHNGVTTGFVGLIRDITARKAMDDQLRLQEVQHRERLAHAARLGTLGELAAGIAHEINQPLAAISSYADATRRMILNRTGDTEALLDALGKIADQANRAGEVIERTRRFIRQRDAAQETLDCNEMIREVQALAETDVLRHGLSLALQLSAEPLLVRGDPIQLQQVLLNLLRNAVDAMDEVRHGQTVSITSTRRGHDWVEIHVDDAGCGLSEEAQSRLFQPFSSTKPDGLGLGLSICRSIVEAHGGELRHSPREGGGTRFSLVLPSPND